MLLPYYRAETSRADVDTQEPSIEAVKVLHDLLRSQEIPTEIACGNLTLAMIRPGLETATNLKDNDASIAETLERQVGDLGVMAKFALRFDRDAINEFYDGPKQRMLAKPSRRVSDMNNQWEEFEDVMLAGPVTVLLLHSLNGDAIELWRQQIGHWNIEENRDPGTIRGKFGLDNYNNLVHGSDSPDSVANELEIIRQCLARKVDGRDGR